MKKSQKIAAAACFAGSAVSLAVGAACHGLRMQPENPVLFTIGAAVGIAMLCFSTLCIAAGVTLLIRSRKGK